MKITFFLLIVCLTEIYANGSRQILDECYRKNGADLDKILQDPTVTSEDILNQITPYKAGCIAVCYVTKKLGNDISIRQRLDDGLNKPRPDLTDAKIAKMRNEVDRCKKEAKDDDCDLMRCLRPWSQQILNIGL